MKESGTPIRLFSFQDIVTSLIGIMVIIILVIVLQLAEATYDYEHPKSDNPEYLELQERLEELARLLREVKERGEEVPEELKAFIYVTLEEIAARTQQAENANAKLNSEMEGIAERIKAVPLSLERLKAEQAAAMEEKGKAEVEKTALEDRQRQLEEEKQKFLAEMRQVQEELERETERVKNEIRIAAEKVEFSFAGIMSRQPILIECSGDGFRAQVYKSGKAVENFTGQGFEWNLKRLLAWLMRNDFQKSYPVLLFRQSAFVRASQIEQALRGLDDEIVLGTEPLDDKVKVF